MLRKTTNIFPLANGKTRSSEMKLLVKMSFWEGILSSSTSVSRPASGPWTQGALLCWQVRDLTRAHGPGSVKKDLGIVATSYSCGTLLFEFGTESIYCFSNFLKPNDSVSGIKPDDQLMGLGKASWWPEGGKPACGCAMWSQLCVPDSL
jgi:hypothetical protein